MDQDSYRYHLILDGKRVYSGVTYDWIRQEAAHQERFQGSRIKLVGSPLTRKKALEWLRKQK